MGLLVLQRDTRKGKNEIRIGDDITIVILGVDERRGNVTIGVKAPGYKVWRAELLPLLNDARQK